MEEEAVERLKELEAQLEYAQAAQNAAGEVLAIISQPAFDLDEVLRALTRSAAVLCRADRAAIYRLWDGEFIPKAVYGISDASADVVMSTRIPTSDMGSIAGRVFASRATVHIPDVKADASYNVHHLQHAAEYRSLLSVPMLHGTAVEGVLSLGKKDPEPFAEQQIRMVEMFAAQALMAISSAWLISEVARQKQRADELLRVILPEEIVIELSANNGVRPRRSENVAVLFCDIAGFTSYCDGREPQEIVAKLQELTEAYEDLASAHGLQKIKTIGDCFMAVAGLLKPVANPVEACLRCGLEMVTTVKEVYEPWEVRVGIHVGPVVAGVLGHKQYLFDLWGDTVNTASRMESNGVPGAVTLSQAACDQVADLGHFDSLGLVPIKGKGQLEVFRFHSWR